MNRLGAAVVAAVLVASSLPAAERKPFPVFKTKPPAKQFLKVPEPPPIRPPTREDVQRALDRGVAFLLKVQNRNGSWGSPHRTKGLNIYAPVPGAHQAFRAAVTALCISALIETAPDQPSARAAVDRAEQWMLKNLPHVRRATPDAIYNVWSHAYSLQALARLYRIRSDEKERKKLLELARLQVEMLQRYESVDGGWGYYDFRVGTKQPASSSISFVNAAALVGLYEIREIGVEVPERLVQRAIDATLRQRKADFSYLYGEYLKWQPMRGINRPAGSLGRSQACNFALRLWGDRSVTDEVLEAWLKRLFARNGWLDIGRKRPIPHEAWFQVAGYFYYFGHYYAARCIELLPPERRVFFQDHLAHTLLPKQERDGSWWDFPFYDYHQQYGTAFALMSLKRCLH